MDVRKASCTIKSGINESSVIRWRNIISFFILGLCNNYGYVVMLSAAYDILHDKFSLTEKIIESNSTILSRGCIELSTGAILLADIIPCLIVKFTVPFLPFYINFRIAMCVISQIFGFLCVSFSNFQLLTILGVALTSFASGLGEVTIMSHSHKYSRESIVAWSSGTGGAGIIGALSYTGLRSVMTTDKTLLVMIVVPILEAITFWLIMTNPTEKVIVKSDMNSQEEIIPVPKKTIVQKLKLLPGLMVFIIPLTLVYLFEYFINQGLYELIQYENIWLSYSEQYRWLQVDYQIGVFLSRSSAIFISFKKIWLLAVFQFLNVIVFTTEAIFFYIPNIWIIFGLTFWEGILGGAAYVNTYYKMTDEVPAENLKESLGIVTMSDSIGITIAGWLAMPVHAAICKLPRPIR